uniref:Uncharacterized protein n=1 Tax=Parascaris univalens TaxID=6257 RepID=A0A915A6I4_PARUN
MSNNEPTLADRTLEMNSAAKPHSPCSARSSPFSSNISEAELDVSSLSRHSSCSSLNHLNVSCSATTGTSSQSKLLPVSSATQSVERRVAPQVVRTNDADTLVKMRLGHARGDSDEDSMEEDSNSSCNDMLNSSFNNAYVGDRLRSTEGLWRSHIDAGTTVTYDASRKFSLNSALIHPSTPSPSTSGRCSPVTYHLRVGMPPRSRVANIRRESNCSVESEAAHEKLIKTAQQVSIGFEEFSIAEKERKRTHSLSEPISILTNAFLPHSCSPSPTRVVDIQKQCYSPSTQQIVRNNITYSPSPSPTPSPTRRIMRSLSPIAVRQLTKRRYTGPTGVDSDGESSSPGVTAQKRACIQQWTGMASGSASPLANERLSSYAFPSPDSSSPNLLDRMNGSSFPAPFPPFRMLLDPAIERQRLPPLASPMDSDEYASTVGDEEHSQSPPPKGNESSGTTLNGSDESNSAKNGSSSVQVYEKRDDEGSLESVTADS